MTEKEQWTWVVGMDGLYEVSTQGRVRSVDRIVHQSEGHDGAPARDRIQRGKILKPYSRNGYLRVHLGHAVRNQKIAWLVLTAFVGPRPAGQLARHLNDVKTDNRLSNLAWGTLRENYDDAKRNGRLDGLIASHGAHNRAKTHCPQGHPYSGDNLYVSPGGKRGCLTCTRRRKRDAARAKRDAPK